MKATYALMLTGLAAQQATAHWDFYHNFKTPDFCKNECDDKQKSGFNWGDLKDGDKVENYGDFNFSKGWSCSSSLGKRDLKTKRHFGSKVVKNHVRKDQPASFSCGSREFSISDMDLSSEFDAELELHYKMEDGSTCKQHASCSAGGTTLKNTQCGGAKHVDVYLGRHHKGPEESCEIGFHNIGFDCNPEVPYNPPSPPKVPETSTPVVSVPVSSAPPAESTPACNGEDCENETPATSYPTGCEGEDCPKPTEPACTGEECPQTTEPACNGEECNSQPPATSTGGDYPASTPEASVPATEVTTPPAVETPATETPEVPVVSTSAYFANSSMPHGPTGGVPPVVQSSIVQSSAVQTPPTQQSSAPAPSCGSGEDCESSTAVESTTVPSISTATPESSQPASPPKPSTPSYPPIDITDVVPRCMNSWLQKSAPDCKDNSDADCYCPNSEFTKNVIDCIASRCDSDGETGKALQYFIGICADHIPKNPKIIEDCPSYAPLTPTTPEAPTGGESMTTPAAETSATPVGEAPAPSYPAGEAPAPSQPACNGEECPQPSKPAGEAPAPSQPAGEAPAPSYPAGEAPAPSYPAGEAPAPSQPACNGENCPKPSAPAGEAPAPSAPAGDYPATVPAQQTPVTNGPTAPPAAESTPCTTITYGTTTLTVPQVHFTTQTNEGSANPTEPVALVPGTVPVETPAATTGGASYPTGAPYPVPSTMGTGYMPAPSGTGALKPSSPAEFTGAAAASVVSKCAMIGAVVAFFAL